MPSLDDTSRCPTGDRCESCGAGDALMVVALDAQVGILCATICDTCIDTDRLPRFSTPAAVGRVMDHLGHVGLTADEAAALMEQEDDDD